MVAFGTTRGNGFKPLNKRVESAKEMNDAA
jgi:hypothetical protein